MNILILGGTKYFGLRLVDMLLDAGHKLTVISRREIGPEYWGKLKFHKADRDIKRELANALATFTFDVAYDQICYAPNQASLFLERTAGKIGKYVLTSTQSVYEKEGALVEADFDPKTLGIRPGDRSDFPFPEKYGDGKRQCEAVYFQKAAAPVAALRIPVVFGPDDYTERLKNLIRMVKDGTPILVPNLESRFSLVHAEDAAKALVLLGTSAITGPLNIASSETLSIGELLRQIEVIVGKKANVVSDGQDATHNPFAGAASRFLDVSRSLHLGFRPAPLQSWLPSLIV